MIILDFENAILIDQSKTKDRIRHTPEYEKYEILESIHVIPSAYYEEIEEAAVVGFDFANEEIILFQPVEWSNEDGTPYPEDSLEEYNSFVVDDLSEYEEMFDTMIRADSFSMDVVNAMADNIINAFFRK